MKKIATNSSYILIVFIIFFLPKCKKSNELINLNLSYPINTILYNKSLDTLQAYLIGKWKYAYGKGGICSTCMHPCDNCSIEFPNGNAVKASFLIKANTQIQWEKNIGTYTNGVETYLMKIVDSSGVPWVYNFDRIENDTLVFHDYSSDPIFYHFTRIR